MLNKKNKYSTKETFRNEVSLLCKLFSINITSALKNSNTTSFKRAITVGSFRDTVITRRRSFYGLFYTVCVIYVHAVFSSVVIRQIWSFTFMYICLFNYLCFRRKLIFVVVCSFKITTYDVCRLFDFHYFFILLLWMRCWVRPHLLSQ